MWLSRKMEKKILSIKPNFGEEKPDRVISLVPYVIHVNNSGALIRKMLGYGV